MANEKKTSSKSTTRACSSKKSSSTKACGSKVDCKSSVQNKKSGK